jgi:hypothetical protein
MKRLVLVALPFVIGGCTKQNTPPGNSGMTDDARITALTLLMKNDINPAFSKLTFLVFHGATMQEDPQKLRIEMLNAATMLRRSMGQLRTWSEPPTGTDQGREVFYTFADSVDVSTQRLVEAIQRNDGNGAARQMEQIADTCNNCHHFFRLKIEDSVVPDSRSVMLQNRLGALQF